MLKLELGEKKKKGGDAAKVPDLVVFKNKRQPSNLTGITIGCTGKGKKALIDTLSILYRGAYFFSSVQMQKVTLMFVLLN